MDQTATEWLASLPLQAHASLLRRLVAEAESETAVRFIELCCSVARGAGDELSGLDLCVGIADQACPRALSAVPVMLGRIGP